MSNISQKLTYLNETKSLIKDGINNLGAELTEENTFRSYKDALDSIYNEYPKVTDEGTDITLENTKKGKITLDKKGQTSQESTSGKQLFDLTKITSTSSFGITATINENTGEIVLNGTSTSTAYIAFDLNEAISSGTIVSYGANNSSAKNNCYLLLTLNNATKQVLQMNTLNAKNENITLDTDINKVYIQVNSGITLNNFVIKPMVNVGNVLEQYEPYTNGPAPNPDFPYPIKKVTGENNIKISDSTEEQNYPLSLGNLEVYEDGYFFKNEIDSEDYDSNLDLNEWYLKNYWGKVVFDGSENWRDYSILDNDTTSWFQTVSLDNALEVLALSNSYLYSDYFSIYNCYSATNTNAGMCYHIDKRIQVRFPNSLLSDTSSSATKVASFKTWLASNNVSVYYVLATPSFTKITSQTLIEQLNNLKNNAKSYKDITNITQTNDDLPFIIKASGLMKGDE